MHEAQRLTYLAHLGIDHYVARKPLQGAAPSVMPPVVVDEATPHLQEMVAESVSTVERQQQVPIKPQTETIRFSLHCWRIGDDLLVLDTHEPGAALPTDTLLLNIVRSIGYPLQQLPQSEPLRWPLFENDQQANDENQARAMVQAYIQAQLSKQPANHLLLMGADAAKFTLDTFDGWQSVRGKHFQQWQSTLIVIPSLAEMLREPLLKRLAWEAIGSVSITPLGN